MNDKLLIYIYINQKKLKFSYNSYLILIQHAHIDKMPHIDDSLYQLFLLESPYSHEYGVGNALKSCHGSMEEFVEMMGGYSN